MTEREAIEVFNKWMDCKDAYQADPSCDGNCSSCEYYASAEEEKEAMQMAVSALKKQEEDRWIPVSKDLPKKNGDYIVTCEVCGERYVEESFFCRCENGGMFWTSQNVIAWQPRIEPYTAEEES